MHPLKTTQYGLGTGGIDPDHDFSVMGDDALTDLASFIVAGLIDVSPYINPDTKAAIGGDAANGEELFTSICAACHGEDGRTINFHDADEPEYVGNIANDNPWEFIHKVRVGQPGTGMTVGLDVGWSMQEVADLLAYAQSLPVEAP
jgi:thiosulfate dehydrogenase